jgi:hypothetical protein
MSLPPGSDLVKDSALTYNLSLSWNFSAIALAIGLRQRFARQTKMIYFSSVSTRRDTAFSPLSS